MGQLKLLEVLAAHRVPLVVIGGHAVNFHGHVRGTEDVDVLWLRTQESERALVEALRQINASWISDEIDPSTGLERLIPVTAQFVGASHLMMLVTDLGLLDLFDFVPGIPDADVREVFRESIPLGNVRYASLAWLRRMKAAANRPRDIEDLEQLG
jgi:hypothetical protein